jgi:DNA-binding response OmpR family regulator
MLQRKLLVIDDEPAITALITRVSEPCGFQVFATSDPAAFRHSYKADPPDAICLDLGMPQVDGIETLGFLAERQCKSPLLIISGFDLRVISTAMRLAEARGLTVAATIPKPINLTALREALAAIPHELKP